MKNCTTERGEGIRLLVSCPYRPFVCWILSFIYNNCLSFIIFDLVPLTCNQLIFPLSRFRLPGDTRGGGVGGRAGNNDCPRLSWTCLWRFRHLSHDQRLQTHRPEGRSLTASSQRLSRLKSYSDGLCILLKYLFSWIEQNELILSSYIYEIYVPSSINISAGV